MSTRIEDRLRYWHDEVSNSHGALLENKTRFLMTITEAREDSGLTYREIAQILGLSESRVQQLVRQSDGRGRSNRWSYRTCKTCGAKRRRLQDGDCLDCHFKNRSS